MKFRSRLIVNLHHLAENVASIKKLAPKSQILFMVKADSYGHGVIPVTSFAYNDLGITEFGCATLAEAVRLREELSDLAFEVYVFSDIQLDAESAEIYLKRRILPVIASMEDLDFLLHIPEFKNFPLCLKFNTGMNRLGFDFNDAAFVVNKLKQHGRNSVYHLMTHFANAGNPMDEDGHNKTQVQNFSELKKYFRDSGITLERTSQSNSGAIEQQFGCNEDTHIRPGIMMYGPTSISPEFAQHGYYKGKLVSRL